MPRKLLTAAAFSLAAAGCSQAATPAPSAVAATVEAARPGVADEEDLVFELATDKLPKSRTQLINGKAVEIVTADWPTIVLTPLKVIENGKTKWTKCTGTLVGPRVVLLAAHCIDDRKSGTLRESFLRADGQSLPMTCAVYPDYLKPPANGEPSPRRSEDFALCYADTKVKLPTLEALSFERVDIQPVAKGSAVLLMGYGCTDLATPYDQDSTLRVGDTAISQAPSGQGSEAAYARILSRGPPEPALCPGDSGGALITGATVEQPGLVRRVRGVNSSIEETPDGLLSRVSMLSHPGFATWAKGWIGKFKGAYICGVSDEPADASCRI